MNDRSSLSEEHKELIGQRNQFPIAFEAGGPFSVSERANILGDMTDEGSLISTEGAVGTLPTLFKMAPSMNSFLDNEIERLLKIAQKMPGNANILNNIGSTYLSKGDLDSATVYFNKALDAKRDFRPAKVGLAKIYTLKGMFDEALAIYSENEMESPRDSKVLMNKAHVYLRQDKIDFAKDMFDKILSFDPENAAAYHNRGIIFLCQHRSNKALADFRKALSLDYRSAATYNAMGVCYIMQNKYGKAIRYFSTSRHIDRSNLTTLKNLASAYQLANEFQKAIELMENHLSTYPMDVEARDMAVFSYLSMKEYRRSLSHLQFLRNNMPFLEADETDSARIYNNIGVAYTYLDQLDKAIEMYGKSIMFCDEEHIVIPYANLLKLYLMTGRTRRADSLVDEYLRREPKHYWPLVLLANYYFEKDDYDKALELGIMALEKGGDTLGALALLNSMYSEALDDLDKALDMAERAYRLKPSNVASLNNLAYSYLRKGDLDHAKALLERMPLRKEYFFAYATKGLLKISEGDVHEGIRLYEQAEGLAPSTELKRLVRQKKRVELGRYYAMLGDIEKAKWELMRVPSIKTNSQLYIHQTQRLLANI